MWKLIVVDSGDMCPHQDVDVTGPGRAWGPISHLMNVVGCEIEALERTHSPLSWWTERSQNRFCLPQPLRVLSTVSKSENGERMAAQKGPTAAANNTEKSHFWLRVQCFIHTSKRTILIPPMAMKRPENSQDIFHIP